VQLPPPGNKLSRKDPGESNREKATTKDNTPPGNKLSREENGVSNEEKVVAKGKRERPRRKRYVRE
jgi:hypothetical protein